MQRRHFLGSAGIATVSGALSMTLSLRPRAARAEDKVKIGFLLKTMQEERYLADKALFISRAQSLGAEVLFDSAGNDALTQLHQVEALLDDPRADLVYGDKTISIVAPSMVTRHRQEHIDLMARFIHEKPQLWNEDIAED